MTTTPNNNNCQHNSGLCVDSYLNLEITDLRSPVSNSRHHALSIDTQNVQSDHEHNSVFLRKWISKGSFLSIDRCFGQLSAIQLYYELPQKGPNAMPAYQCIDRTNSNEGKFTRISSPPLMHEYRPTTCIPIFS